MRLAQIERGLVINVIEVDGADRPAFASDWPEALIAGPGWSYDGKTFSPPVANPTPADVNAQRDRRIAAGFAFQGAVYDCDAVSLQRITGAATLAGFAVLAGAATGDLRWHGGAADFAWITAANVTVTMNAQTCFAFGKAAAAHQSRLIFAAKALKATSPIPADFADDIHWL